MIRAKGSSLHQMALLLAFLVSVVVLTSAIRSETGGNDRTSPVLNPKTDGTANSPCCAVDIQVRLKRSPSTPGVGKIVSGKGSSVPKLKQSQRSKGKETLSDMDLRWQSTRDGDDGKSIGDNQVERGNLEEVFEERRDGTSNGKWVVKNETSRDGIKPSAKTVDRTIESDRKGVGSRKLGEDSRGINRFLSVGWSKPKSAQSARDTGNNSSRSRRDLRAIKRMLDDAGITPVDADDFPEEEGPPEMSEEEPEMYEDNAEVPQMGESVSGDATRRQDFSKRPKYYPDWGPKRTWRINMMRVWGKRYLSGYDRNHALWNN